MNIKWRDFASDSSYPYCHREKHGKLILNETVCALEDLGNADLVGITGVLSGMAIGFDQILAIAAIEYLGIPVFAAIPFEGQEEPWPKEAKALYHKILSKCEMVTVICSGGYADWKYHARDEWLVDNSDHLLACWNGSPGGTAYTRDYAVKQKKPITNIWSDGLEKMLYVR